MLTEAHPDLNFVVRYRQRIFLCVAGNLHWRKRTRFGLPVWQLADDLAALQRIVFNAGPDCIFETGTRFDHEKAQP